MVRKKEEGKRMIHEIASEDCEDKNIKNFENWLKDSPCIAYYEHEIKGDIESIFSENKAE